MFILAYSLTVQKILKSGRQPANQQKLASL